MATSMRNATAFRGALQKLKLPTIPIPERLKGGRLEKMGRYMGTIVFDYKEAIKDIFKTAAEKPVKSGFYFLLTGAAIYAIFNNPDEESHATNIQQYSTEIATVDKKVRNSTSEAYLSQVQSFIQTGVIRRLNLAVFSILWVDDHHQKCTSYLASCPPLKVRWRDIPQRIIDVGFLNRWFLLEREMKDYDVNPEEWKYLEEQTAKS